MLKRYLLNPNRSSETECNELFAINDTNRDFKLSLVLDNPETTMTPVQPLKSNATTNSYLTNPKRNTLFSPYKGYAIDQAAISVSYGDGVSNIESQSIVRNMNYKEKLAYKLHVRHTYGYIKKLFTVWKRHSFRYVFLRRQLLKCYMMSYRMIEIAVRR